MLHESEDFLDFVLAYSPLTGSRADEICPGQISADQLMSKGRERGGGGGGGGERERERENKEETLSVT